MDHHHAAAPSSAGRAQCCNLVPTATLPLFAKQGHAKDMQDRFNNIVQFLTPKQAGGAVLTTTCRASLSEGNSTYLVAGTCHVCGQYVLYCRPCNVFLFKLKVYGRLYGRLFALPCVNVCSTGDAGDVLMIGISLAVFVYLAMQMYRLYYYFYLQLGVVDMMQ